jgi:hypothetical protein
MESTLGDGSQMILHLSFSINKNFFSTVHMAVADSDYCFISVEVRTCAIIALYQITTVSALSLLVVTHPASVHKESTFWLR